MKWIETSIAIERVAIASVATLFEQYEKNGFIEEDFKNDSEIVWLTFFAEIEDRHPLLTEKGKYWRAVVEETLYYNKIKIYAPITVSIVGEEDWITGYKEYTKEVEILPNFIICPKWHTYTADDEETVYYYDNELSFGTGTHETTYCCAQMINLYGKDANKILDIGTGTGILLLVAHYVNKKAKLFGIDIDDKAVLQAKNNCMMNHIDATIIEGDLSENYNDKADLVVANLTVDPLLFLLPSIETKLADNGVVIISGIVDERFDEILPYIENGWKVIEHIHKRNWHTFALQKS